MDDEAPRHRDVGGEDHPQQERRIEDVAMHGGDVWHPPEQVGIPQREPIALAQGDGRELAERVAGDVLVAVRPDKKLAGERGPPQRQGRERVGGDGPRIRAPGMRDRGLRGVDRSRHQASPRVPCFTEPPKICPRTMRRRRGTAGESPLLPRNVHLASRRQASPGLSSTES